MRTERGRGLRAAAAAGALAALAGAGAAQLQAHESLQQLVAEVELTHVTGTPDMVLVGSASVANLDAGDLAAGVTGWLVDGVLWIETRVGYLWSARAGSQPFEVPTSIYFNDNLQFPADVADDGTVVGANWFTLINVTRPFRWTRQAGFEFLPVPGPGWSGSAVAVSRDGSIVAGVLQEGFAGTQRTGLWTSGVLALVGPPGQHSAPFDLSHDGSVAVGELGPSPASASAARWVGGVLAPLAPVPGATASTARLTSDDGARALGWATVGGQDVLVVWEADGSASAHRPPPGFEIERLNATSPAGDAVVGALDQGGDWAPFLWREGEGFTVIGELGLEPDYDLSEAKDLSDDGRRVVGDLQSSVVSQGFPPTTAFLWTAAGTQAVDDLLLAGGHAPQGLFSATAISGDGRRILATGVFKPTNNDSTSTLIELVEGQPLLK